MADPSSITLNATELQSLADRLYARGHSRLKVDSIEQSRDLLIASKSIRSLLSEVDRIASCAGDIAHQLAHLRVTVE